MKSKRGVFIFVDNYPQGNKLISFHAVVVLVLVLSILFSLPKYGPAVFVKSQLHNMYLGDLGI